MLLVKPAQNDTHYSFHLLGTFTNLFEMNSMKTSVLCEYQIKETRTETLSHLIPVCNVMGIRLNLKQQWFLPQSV